MRGKPAAKSVDAYIKAAPEALRPKLEQMRSLIRHTVPGAQEGISYGMPYYKFEGPLVGFGLFKNHIGFFPGAIVEDFKHVVAGYKTSKGTVQLPLDGRLPVGMIRLLLKASAARNKYRAEEKRRTTPRKRLWSD